MTDKPQPDKFDWATELSDAQGHVTLSAQEAKEIGARLRSMRAKLKTYEDFGDAGSDVQLLRTGYEAARLEIESLKAQLHAAKQINTAQFWLFTSSIPGSALRVSHWQAPAQAAAPAQADEYPALVCDYCGALTPDPWHSSGMLHGKMSKHIHSCDACCRVAAQAAPKQEALEQAGERVYAFRRKGLADFCTCDEARYEELSNKPNLFETRIFYTTPQPAPASQGDALDAARYRWLAASCRSTSEHWGGRWSIIIDGPAPKSHDSEDDFDAAVDAARKQGANHD